MRRIAQLFSLITLVSAFAFAGASTATAAPASTPFTCTPGFYQVINGQLNTLNPITGMYTPAAAPAGDSYNSLGYNVADNFLYGIGTSGNIDDQLIKVDADGNVSPLTLTPALPTSTKFNYVTGDFDSNGDLMVRGATDTGANTSELFKINVAGLTWTKALISPAIDGFDFVNIKSGADDNLYTLSSSGVLTTINLTTNTSSSKPVSGIATGANFGAGWTDSAHDLFFSQNSDGADVTKKGHIFQIRNYDTTPTAVSIVESQITDNNDGASCPNAATVFGTPTAVNDAYTTPFNTTLTVAAPGIMVNDSGTTITVTSHTGTSHGTLTAVNPDGSFTYIPNDGFIGVDTFDYTITDSLGQTAHATVTITIEGVQASNVTNTPTGSDSVLATTGSSSSVPMTIAAFLFMLFGFVMLRTAKRMQLARIARRHK